MAQYNKKIRGLIEGLSDFWLLYFKDLNQLETLYQGTDILVGQAYLDLISLILNNSVQDAPLFNKEFFKLIQIKETETKFVKGLSLENDRFTYVAENNLVKAPFLNNKLLSVTDSLQLGVDYTINDKRIFEFKYDPLNAYLQRTFGVSNNAFTVRTKDPLLTSFYVELLDDGTTPVALSLNNTGTTLTIAYDGPTNTGTVTSADIVAAINTHPVYSGLLVASLVEQEIGYSSPNASVAVPLVRVSANPLDGFASRLIEQSFGGVFTNTTITDWSSYLLDIQKGDILRFISGPTVGSPLEFEISLVRPDGLYIESDGAVNGIKAGNLVEFAVLREPKDNLVITEPLAASGTTVQTGTDGVITALTRTFSSVTANFSNLHLGDIIELMGSSNIGYGRIIGVTSSTAVVLDFPATVNESFITWNLISTVSGATYTNGILTNNNDGTATFTSASAAFTPSCPGTVIKIYRAGALEKYAVLRRNSATSVTVSAATTVSNGTSLTWAWANSLTPTTTVAFPQIKKGSVNVVARRLVDEQAVVEGIDYKVLEDEAQIVPLTVWRTAMDQTVDYTYRLVIMARDVNLQSGSNGTLTYGTISTFSSPSASFTYQHIGQAIHITNSASGLNNGVFYISAVTSSTTVQLTSDRKVSSTVDGNNGSLVWKLRRRGVLATENITALIHELSFWAPDVLIDRFHLYNTFGYLINRYAESSEEYRSLIRGIFQLFMLGPTLERFESAINTVAGLSVVRDNAEILLKYVTDSYATGSDGYLDGSTKYFTSASANFSATAAADYIYISSGLNKNVLYKVLQVIDSNTLLLEGTPITDGPVSWEISVNATQTVITSRNTYTFKRNIPLRSSVTNPANIGVKLFKAFEVLTEVFQVTDYVETPTWWERIQIPAELWENEDALRRQSTPALIENVIGPTDDARIGDPGFIIGADSQGFVPPSVLKYDDGGLNDGVLEGDPYYPVSNNVFFESTTNTLFTSADTDHYLVTSGTYVGRFRILSVVSSTRVKLEAFKDIPDTAGVTWQVEAQAVPLRHKAAFVILDTWLKHHLFNVSFDPVLLGELGSILLNDLKSLVFIAKPSYTYIILSPSSLFQEILQVDETFIYSNALSAGGSAGENILGTGMPLVIGSGWKIGSWFRYVENASTFAAPAASVTNTLGAPTAGYQHHISKFCITNSFTSGGVQIPYAKFVEYSISTGSNASLTAAADYMITLPGPGPFTDAHVGAIIRITNAVDPLSTPVPTDNKDYVIGRVISATTVAVGASHSAITTGDWELITVGSPMGAVSTTATGETVFTDSTSTHLFYPADVGTYVRFIYGGNAENVPMRINYVGGSGVNTCKMATVHRVLPATDEPDEVGSITGVTLTVATPMFSDEMCYNQRYLADPTTAAQSQYYIVFTSGANNGQRRRLQSKIDDFNGVLQGASLTTDLNASFYIELDKAYETVAETSSWEHIDHTLIFTENTVDLSNTPTQDVAAAVSYTAYGIREPIDPSLEVFDDTAGDTYYAIGMLDPRPDQGRSRTSRDTDLREDPIQITRT